ncbi:hypothetical protein Leryth_014703 [Lithospermum erythrorhizon]|nr:hypothetical protein Leryth_014703 [Lithospermum erythrorhizon]
MHSDQVIVKQPDIFHSGGPCSIEEGGQDAIAIVKLGIKTKQNLKQESYTFCTILLGSFCFQIGVFATLRLTHHPLE